jgi:hypothetical protein
MWGRGANMSAMTLIAEAVQVLSEHPLNRALSERLIALFTSLMGSAYDLDKVGDEPAPVSLITAPIFNADGEAQWELHIAPFRPSLSPAERTNMIAEIKSTARELGRHSG